KLNSIAGHFQDTDFDYNWANGEPELRGEIANMFNRHFYPVVPVKADDIVVTNGCTSAIEMLAFAMCNPGDHVLIPAPCYGSLDNDMSLRARAVATPVKLPLEEAMTVSQISYFERAIDDIERMGGRIYALSVFDRSEIVTPFESVLSWFDLDSYIDPSSVVVLHGLSKDFGLNGFRMGWMLSPWNKDLLKVVTSYAQFGYRPSYTDRLISKFLSDHHFIDSMLKNSQRLLANNYAHAVEFFDIHRIQYIPCTAGHFVWFRLPVKACTNTLLSLGLIKELDVSKTKWTVENEMIVWQHMVCEKHVFMPTGQAFCSPEPGWFRLTFAICKEQLDLALERIGNMIK
ncbi:hypothetical protein GGI05_004331, partial [Coemansia sp. RSA 2603]